MTTEKCFAAPVPGRNNNNVNGTLDVSEKTKVNKEKQIGSITEFITLRFDTFK